MMKRTDALKKFFGSTEKPVDNRELLQLRKEDPNGYNDLVDEIRKQHPEWEVEGN